MDLSAVIFVVLAIAWAGYLIPKAVQHHDDVEGSRLDEGHGEKARVLSRRRTPAPEATEPVADVEQAPEPANVAAPRALPTRAAARRAARRRRQVLYVLLSVAAVVTGLAAFALVPWWSVAVPAGLVVAFLVVARLSVRAQRRARQSGMAVTAPVEAEAVDEQVSDPRVDPAGILLQEREAALADDGSLWDPLPLTLPTYVGKARARRTVRTIELTGISSSGHDAVDTALAREAEEARRSAEAEKPTATEGRKVAGA